MSIEGSHLDVFRSRDGKYVRFCLVIKGKDLKDYCRGIKLKTDDGISWYISENGVYPYSGMGAMGHVLKEGLCYYTRKKMGEFQGMKPGERRCFEVVIKKPVWISISEKKRI